MASNSRPAGVARPALADGFAALRANRIDDAVALRERWLELYAHDPEVRYFAAEVAAVEGELDGAIRHLDEALVAAPGQWPLLLKRARLLLALRRRGEFRRDALEAEQAAAGDPRALWEIGHALLVGGETLAAKRILERLPALGLDLPAFRLNLASAQFFAGEFEAAEATLAPAIERQPDFAEAFHLRSTLRRQSKERNHVADIRRRLGVAPADPARRAPLLYALAKELEDLGDDAGSFAALVEGAAAKRRSLHYRPEDELEAIAEVRGSWSASAVGDLPAADPSDGPIFVVGMPRTGTTLVERMLDRHPDVVSAGELMDFKLALGDAVRHRRRIHPDESPARASLGIDFRALGQDYLRGAREAADGGRRPLDKMPVNFLYCGLILKALPNARIIHLAREPMDAGYAVFKTLFQQAYFFSYDQAELADYLVAYHRTMAHWQAVLPGRVLTVRYEDLVTDTEAQARRMLEHCGLSWVDAILAPDRNERPSTTASAAQVREPVHARSVGRWRAFADGLAPLRDRLFDAGVIDADGRGC